MKNFLKSLLVVVILFNLTYAGCHSDSLTFKVNKTHLDYLYEEVKIDNNEMGIIHIYCDAPSYKYVYAKGEGYACVDDAARAALFYLEYLKTYNDSASLNNFNMLTNFVLHMQAENGFFYNFLENDNSINKSYRTSLAEPNWWSWRALWLLTESYNYYKDQNPVRANIILNSIENCVTALKKEIQSNKKTKIIDGIKIPESLPAGSGADQAALVIISLSNYYQITNDKSVLNYINSSADGIMLMQVNDPESPLDGAFLSWENTWHAWGNSQSYALLKAWQITKDEKFKVSALKELDQFYPHLLKNNFLAYFEIKKSGNKTDVVEESKYSQIAYDIRPMVFALLEAYKITGKVKYAEEAGKISQWFTGNNVAKTAMYNSVNGLVFDGISDANTINNNSGAESTIEALWTLLKISQNPIALKIFQGEIK